MNSYPPELLMQLAPVMFVAGLPSASADAAPNAVTEEGLPPDEFTVLAQRLRDVLGSQRKPAIWAPEALRKSKAFQVVFTDKTVQFPPRKIPDPASPPAVHSALSPLHPSSPLYPDGLIAPIWIRKHTTLVPSVFVLTMRLFEHTSPPPMPRSPLEPEGADIQKEREEREREERKWDSELAKQIAERKKSTNERGMKLTVVLMASRKMLDEPSLDSRLTFIRRSSGLDSRAALFVLSPVSPSELTDFVKSLQQALYEPAIEYYAAHSKRVRRKRNRHSQSATASAFPHGLVSNAPRALPLRPEGWTVRYEYKMACFAEFRGETEVALKHYQDAHAGLLIMFGSPAILQPRTKRWAEAKVLADTVNFKICKLFLYNAEHSLALSQHNSHVRRFCDLSSRVWGIGEDTFEYWSWLARQHRVFAELLEQGAHFSLTIPNHMPSPPSSASTQPSQDIDALQALGINPSTAVMHPGFYYYGAAECTEQRRIRYLQALDAEASQQNSQAPGFQNEKRVDHLGTILELYTKAYELFKKHSPLPSPSHSQLSGRFTLWIAYKIAQTYYASGKYDMAIRFFERISKTYEREKWAPILHPLLSTWYNCAQQLGDVDMSIRLLTEMIARGVGWMNADDDEPLAEDLNAILKSTVPSSEDALKVDLTDTDPPFDSSVVFWSNEIKLDEDVPFQISLHMPTNVNFLDLPLTTLRFYLSDDSSPIVIKHASPEGGKDTCLIHLGHTAISPENVEENEVEGNLRWQPGSALVFSGSISSSVPREIKFTKGEITIAEGNWRILVPFILTKRRDMSVTSSSWLASESPTRFIPIRRSNVSSVVVKTRPHQVHVAISHNSPAYIDETYPINIDVTNGDDRELEIMLDVLLQPGEEDQANRILMDDEDSTSLIKGNSFGRLAPGVTACKTLKLACTGSTGERMVDLSIQSRTVRTDNQEGDGADASEILQTLTIPVVSPFAISSQTTYVRGTASASRPADLTTFEPDYWNDTLGGKAHISTVLECADCVGASSVVIDNIRLVPEEHTYSQILYNSLNNRDFPLEFMPGDQFLISCELSLAPPDDSYEDEDAVLPSPGYFVIQWSRLSASGQPGEQATTRIALPTLKPPSDGLVAVLHVPPLAYLHEPFALELVITNKHPTRTACPSLSIEHDPSSSSASPPHTTGDSFVIAGMRSGRLPVLVPGAETRAHWRLIPLECGTEVRLPHIKLRDLRAIVSAPQREREQQAQVQQGDGARDGDAGGSGAAPATDLGDEIPIIDGRWDRRKEDGSDAAAPSLVLSAGEGEPKVKSGQFTIRVSPA